MTSAMMKFRNASANTGSRPALSASDRPLLALRVGGGQVLLGLEPADLLGALEALRQEMDERCIDVVDAAAQPGELCGNLGHVAHAASLGGSALRESGDPVPRNAGLRDDALDVAGPSGRRRALAQQGLEGVDGLRAPLGHDLHASVSGVAGVPDETELERACACPPPEADALHRATHEHRDPDRRARRFVRSLVHPLTASWLPGGFLGVDVFFVVSGFLITTLLLREHHRSGRIALSQFWVRRARRLLPALVLCVVTSVLIARGVSQDLLVDVGRQMLGALTFSTNWLEITAGTSYFDQTAPQLFMNFWSLAVEEQFYLLWPLLTLALLALSSRMRVGVAVAVGAASSLLMAALFTPGTDATRVYYGTDTHVMGLMAGAALAFAWASPRLPSWVAPSRWGRFGSYAVPLALGVLLAEMAFLDEQSTLTFRGGIVAASLATAVLVMGLVEQRPDGVTRANGVTPVRRVMRHPAASWVGARSYSIYLWHWPVILLVALDNPSAPGTTSHLLTRLWCVLVTLALADLTFRFVETPFRTLGFRGVSSRLRRGVSGLTLRGKRGLGAVVAVLAVVTAVIVVTAPDQSETARMLAENEAAADATPTPAASAGATPAATSTPFPATTTGAPPSGTASAANASFT